MIRLLSRVSARPESVRDIFTDVDSWPLWMPGLRSLEIRERERDRLVVRAVQRQMGRDWTQIQEISLTHEGLRQRQLEGGFRHWDAEWRFLVPPDRRGTTVSLNLDFDPGWVGRMVPSWTLQSFLDRLFEEVVQQLELRASAHEPTAAPPPSSQEVFLRVQRTLAGLEVEIAGERYLLRRSR